MSEPRISVRNLTKAFALRRRKRLKGISADSAAAVGALFRHTLRSPERQVVPTRGDPNHLFALDDISFDVPAGQVLGIIGRNGAGKSTLLKILARLIEPTEGRIRVQGRVASLLDLGLGLSPELTVRENIQMQGRLSGIRAADISAAEERILEFAGLTAHRDSPLGLCPTGSFIQLAFSTTINLESEIVLADEVLAVGDSRFRAECEERIRAVGESGEAVLFVSHDMNAIKRTCSRVIWIDRGRLVMDGSPDEVVDAYMSELLAGHLLPEIDETSAVASCRLLDLRLLDATRAQVGALEITAGGYVDTLLRITSTAVSVRLVIELWQGKYMVLSCASPKPITINEPGTLRAGVRVPGDFLNENSYRARCIVYVLPLNDPEREPVVAAEEELEFSVMNPSPERSVWATWRGGRTAALSPRLDWTLESEDA